MVADLMRTATMRIATMVMRNATMVAVLISALKNKVNMKMRFFM